MTTCTEMQEKLTEIAQAMTRLEWALDKYFAQHGPSCDEHPSGDLDQSCELCAIDNDISTVLRRVLYLCEKY